MLVFNRPLRAFLFFLISFALLAPPAVSAEVLRYTDTAGITHYVDSVEKIPEEFRGQLENAAPLPTISTVDSPKRKSYYNQKISKPLRARRGGDVEIYVTSWCGYCRKLEKFLTDERIAFTSYDIERDSKAKARYDSFGGKGVPVSRVGGTTIRGYNPKAITAALQQ